MGYMPLGREPTPEVPQCRPNPADRGTFAFERRSAGAAGLPARNAPVRLARNAKLLSASSSANLR